MGKKKKKNKSDKLPKNKQSNRLDFNGGIAIISLIVSFITLVFSFYIYTRQISNDARKSQLNLVLELVEVIQNDPIAINSFGVRRDTVYGPLNTQKDNIFTISNWKDEELKFDLFISGNYKWPMESDKFLSNPLLPKNIAEAMYRFRTDYSSSFNTKIDTINPYLVLGIPTKRLNSIDLRNTTSDFEFGQRIYNGGTKNFKNNAKSIRKEIIEYFKNNDIEFINPILIDESDGIMNTHPNFN